MIHNSNNSGFISYFQKILIKAFPIMSASYSLFISTLFLSALGYIVDKKLNTFPIIFLICLFLGLILGFYQLARKMSPKKKWFYTLLPLYYLLVLQYFFKLLQQFYFWNIFRLIGSNFGWLCDCIFHGKIFKYENDLL